MVGGDADDGPKRRQPAERIVQLRVEIVDLRRAGGVLVLDVIGQRQVHQLGTVPLQQFDAGFQHKEGKLGRVDIGQRPAYQVEHLLDTVRLARTLIGAL